MHGIRLYATVNGSCEGTRFYVGYLDKVNEASNEFISLTFNKSPLGALINKSTGLLIIKLGFFGWDVIAFFSLATFL